jgi:micrococcal nuclease
MLGYDTPERGECGYVEATNALRSLLASGTVTELSDGDDQDRYDRYLRHIYVNGVPVGLTLIQQGWANARYDSLDGDDRHIRQDEYRSADGPHNCGIRAD